ncbi:MAG: cytochrome c biogenesis protein ResB [Armatimonadetes bacterium]|nr:cytochrome c biogenesis protein ResB [Armatimonadota bacterium]
MSEVDLRDDVEKMDNSPKQKDIGAMEALWSLFSSMKTAIVLLLGLAAVSIFGTVIEDKHGITIYHSSWFSVLLVLVGINLAVCSINRFGIAWRKTVKPCIETDSAQVAAMNISETVSSSDSVESATQKLLGALRGGSYRPLSRGDEKEASIYAAKGSAVIWGPYLTHLSILVIFIGAIFGGILGTDGNAIILEGEKTAGYFTENSNKQIPLGFEVKLKKFEIKHDGKGNPTAYRSDLQVYDGGKVAAHKIIDVNHPLTYNGMTFYQSDYGIAGVIIKVTSPDGDTASIPFEVGLDNRSGAKMFVIAEEPFKEFTLSGKKWTIFVHDLVPDYIGGKALNRSNLPVNVAVNIMLNDRFPEYKGLDAWKRLGWVPVSKTAEYDGLKVTLEEVINYTGLQVARNPALPIVYAGFILMVVGLFMSFYVTRRIIRISVVESGSGSDVTIGASSKAEPEIFEKDFKRLRESIS